MLSANITKILYGTAESRMALMRIQMRIYVEFRFLKPVKAYETTDKYINDTTEEVRNIKHFVAYCYWLSVNVYCSM